MKAFKRVLLVLVLVLGVFIITGCGKKEENITIVGTWEYQSGSYVYTFNEDLTGTYNAGGTVMEFTYKTDGNKLSILYKNSTVPFETEYSIDGKVLNVKDSSGKDTLYNRK